MKVSAGGDTHEPVRGPRFGWAFLLASAASLACAPDTGDTTGAGGSSGTTGSAGTSATAGSGGATGNAGSGGTSGGGPGGSGGGNAGVAGSTAGTSGGGVTGTGGGGVAGTGGGVAGAGGSVAGTGGGTGGRGGATGGVTGTGGRGGAAGGGAAGAGGRGGAAGTGTGGNAGRGGAGGGGGALPPVTVWIAGDSTVASGSSPCPIGWGGPFPTLFGAGATIKNSAVGGRSVRTWLYNVQTTMDATGECVLAEDASGNPTLQSRWSAMLNATSGMKAGDYLFIQFGINDSSATCDRHVGVEAFKVSYGMMAQAAKDRGAHPIFVTPLSMIRCSGTTAVGSREPYVTATKDAGTQYSVPVIDLHGLSVAAYNQHAFCPIPGGGDVSATTTGPVGDYFCDDHTHLSPSGALDIAGVMAKALRDQNIPLAAYLK